MGILAKSPAELTAMTKPEILTAIAQEQNELRAAERNTVVVSQSEHPEGRGMLERTEETRDGNGKLISTTRKTWTYHEKPTDGVHDITTVETDGTGKETRNDTVRHEGGRVWQIDNLKAGKIEG